ncbi:MAG TPA: arylesterase [Alphaproteobacteria bacterium]|nr:arylesterase [Alphaproteobacteria bacterium]
MTVIGAVASSPAPKTIVAFGDSYFSGFGVEPEQSFPAQLERALRARGHNARVINSGVPGETIEDGLRRLDATLAARPDLIILELGANDGEQGLDPAVSRANLDSMIARIREAHVRVLLCGAEAPDEFGETYRASFDPIFPAMAAKHQVPLYPFVLDGVARNADLIQEDGEHPNVKGVRVMVDRMLPAIEHSISLPIR